MKKFHGTGISGAIAIGNVSVFKHLDIAIHRKRVEDTDAELKRVSLAEEKAVAQLSEIYEKAVSEIGRTYAHIFEIHIMMIKDIDYNKSIQNIIKTQSVNAEYAVAQTSEAFGDIFSGMDDSYIKARVTDIRDISNRIIACLLNSKERKKTTAERVVICADDLTPSEAFTLDKSRVLAFVTAFGSPNSHTAILAGNMNIPAVINVGEELLNEISDGEKIIVDGHTGDIIIVPDRKTEEVYLKKQSEDNRKRALLQELKGKENVTKDGTKVDIYANIDGVDGIGDALSNDAGGIGLFRSEFLYLENRDFPAEETQFAAYKKVLESMAGKKVIIRTLDIGADKQVDYFNLEKEENPALGYRAIRICLTHPEIFRTQLRALLRASVYGNLGIMFPMITSINELCSAKKILEQVKAELKNEGLAYCENIEIGIMIETPAAALISDELAAMVDFFSIGTNDLIQYALACDRQNARLEPFIDTHHKAVMRLIEMSVQNAHKSGIRIGICGELAADTSLTETFLKMGIDELSVSAPFVLPLRDAVRKIDLKK